MNSRLNARAEAIRKTRRNVIFIAMAVAAVCFAGAAYMFRRAEQNIAPSAGPLSASVDRLNQARTFKNELNLQTDFMAMYQEIVNRGGELDRYEGYREVESAFQAAQGDFIAARDGDPEKKAAVAARLRQVAPALTAFRDAMAADTDAARRTANQGLIDGLGKLLRAIGGAGA